MFVGRSGFYIILSGHIMPHHNYIIMHFKLFCILLVNANYVDKVQGTLVYKCTVCYACMDQVNNDTLSDNVW